MGTQTIGALMLAASLLPATAGAASVFGTNLIVNGDAEADVGSSAGGTIATVTGFTTTGNFTEVLYGAPGGFPLATDPGPVNRGLNFFAGGPAIASSRGTQKIDLSSGASAIDHGASFALSAYLGGFSSQRDNAVLSVSFLDGVGNVLGTDSLGSVTNVDRGNLTGLLFRGTTGAVPVGTRSAEIVLDLTRIDGSYNDGYADNLSLVVTAVPEPETYVLFSAGLAALFVRRRLAKR